MTQSGDGRNKSYLKSEGRALSVIIELISFNDYDCKSALAVSKVVLRWLYLTVFARLAESCVFADFVYHQTDYQLPIPPPEIFQDG